MVNTVADVLERAADLLSKPGAWTQGTYARGKSGRRVINRQSAVCFCAIGAMDFVQGAQPGAEIYLEPIRVATLAATGDRLGNLSRWNDMPGRTQGEVVIMLRKAAKLARAESIA